MQQRKDKNKNELFLVFFYLKFKNFNKLECHFKKRYKKRRKKSNDTRDAQRKYMQLIGGKEPLISNYQKIFLPNLTTHNIY